jgi:hypothetical protein
LTRKSKTKYGYIGGVKQIEGKLVPHGYGIYIQSFGDPLPYVVEIGRWGFAKVYEKAEIYLL